MDLIKKLANKETFLYLIFGVLSTILNIILFYIFINILKMSIFWGNLLDTAICILFQYLTNRIWVFESKNKGKDAIREFIQFMVVRSITVAIDQIFVVIGVDFVVARFIASSQQIFFGLCVKILSNIVIIILNYIFSKFFVFQKKSKVNKN